jgi:hypothetical protein
VLLIRDAETELGGSEESWKKLEDGKVEDREGKEGAEFGGTEVNES